MKKYNILKDIEDHCGFEGETLKTELWLAKTLKKLTGIEFKKYNVRDIDLVSVVHDPKIYIEVEWTMDGKGKWPKGYPYPVTWMRKSGHPSVPFRKMKMFSKYKDMITVFIKINDKRDECFFTDGELILKRSKEKNRVIIRENSMSRNMNLPKEMVELDECDIYHGFSNIDTFLKRKIERFKNEAGIKK